MIRYTKLALGCVYFAKMDSTQAPSELDINIFVEDLENQSMKLSNINAFTLLFLPYNKAENKSMSSNKSLEHASQFILHKMMH